MTDDLVKRLRKQKYRREIWVEPIGTMDAPCDYDDYGAEAYFVNPDGPEAADRIEAQAAEIERLREFIKGPAAWLDRWATHVGNCQGGYSCTCGLVLARTELGTALGDTQ